MVWINPRARGGVLAFGGGAVKGGRCQSSRRAAGKLGLIGESLAVLSGSEEGLDCHARALGLIENRGESWQFQCKNRFHAKMQFTYDLE